jgi:hypothetical protein
MLPRSALVALDNATPHINPLIAKGLAVHHMKNAEAFIDSVFRIVAKSFPPEIKYLGSRRCTPYEEYAEASRSKQSRIQYDVARSDIYLVEYKFQFLDEEPIKRFIYLPFVGQAGTIFLSGSRFVISPVLADQVISVSLNSVFVRLLKAKLTFNRVNFSLKIDGASVPQRIAWAKIYNKKPNKTAPKATTSAKSTLVHYLLAKYGLHQMYALFADCHPIIGREEITRERFPQSDWVICESLGFTPRNYKSYYSASELKIAIPRVEWNRSVELLTAGVFYVIDHFPDNVAPEHVDDPRLWQHLLGQVIWSGHVSAGKLINDVNDHILSLDEYLDTQHARKLKDIGYESRDIYHLMFHIINNYDEWSQTADDRVSTMYDKELNVLQFVCYDTISAINQLYFNIVSAKKKDYANSTQPARSFNRQKVERMMGMNLRQGLVWELTKGDHGEVTTTGTSGDNMALKVTSLLTPQNKSTKQTGKSRVSLEDPTKRLHVSVAEVGGCWALPKADPDGRSRINPTIQIIDMGDTALVERDIAYKPQLDSIQRLFARK